MISEGDTDSIATSRIADVLLITVTKVEALAVLDLVEQKFGRKALRVYPDLQTYYDLGDIKGARVYMVRSEIGSGGPSGALLTVSEAIAELSPSAVIMVGIAFGVDPEAQQVGDILVSRQIHLYELQRVSTADGGEMRIIPRGDRVPASPRLLDRFRDGELSWEGPTLHFGLILSGEKLVDSMDFREQLRDLEPEAVGGEMEGAGLYAAAHRRKVDWILVKAICDWADGKKHENKQKHQALAAQNAAKFAIHVIEHGGFADSAASAKQSMSSTAQASPLPERHSPSPAGKVTPEPLPVGSSLCVADWEIRVQRIEMEESLSSPYDSDKTEKAAGRFALLYLTVTNRGPLPKIFNAHGVIEIQDAEGRRFEVNGVASTYAGGRDGTELLAKVNPGARAYVVAAFDILGQSGSYVLMPNWLTGEYGASVMLEIP